MEISAQARETKKQMKISQRLEGEFPSAIRQRGQTYHWNHQIRIRSGDARDVQADVTGSERYGISLHWDEPFLTVWCDCPYFEREGPCKHIWGTILGAETQGYLADAAKAPSLILDDGEFDEDEEEEDEAPDGGVESTFAALQKTPGAVAPKSDVPSWKAEVHSLVMGKAIRDRFLDNWPAKREIVYQVDVQSSLVAGNLVIALETRDRKTDGSHTPPVRANIKRGHLRNLPLADREIMSLLAGGLEYHGWGDPDAFGHVPSSNLLTPALANVILPMAVKTGRCFLKKPRQAAAPTPVELDEGEPWEFELQMTERKITGWTVTGFLRRGEERVGLSDTALVTEGFVFFGNQVARLAPGTQTEWVQHMRRSNGITASDKDGEALMAELLTLPSAPPLHVPAELAFEEISPEPRKMLKIRARAGVLSQTKVCADLQFDYAGTMVSGADKRGGVYDAATRRFVRRNAFAEEAAATILRELGFRQPTTYDPREDGMWHTHTNKVPAAVRKLIESGWHVEAEGKIFRKPGGFRMEVASGVDWFELHGEVQYGDSTARLPELLEAVRRGENTVRLGDGTYGVLPEEWLQRIGLVAGLGTAENGHIRFRGNQAGLLDALLAAQPEVSCDAAFTRVREQLSNFEGVRAAEQPAGFNGQLRDYQREGLGWMEFLRRLSFGGCLADDMGVGKTAQVLALLETRRELRAKGEVKQPSLVVVPRSLVFNWQEEAARFTPNLKVLDYTGVERAGENFESYDLVLTTYGTLRRDVPLLKDIEFDYLILDEAQAIKNSDTESAKAVRLLKGSHRLALSGTPVENHLGEIFSLFEFLNPGMLNAASVFKIAGGGMRNVGEESLSLLSHALRPFILRRTKEQVARELPPKTEQTIYCELKPAQRKLYDELRQHYRNTLLGKIAKDGIGKSKIQVLEALLRLRQAACHPALIDSKREGEASAKMDILLARLKEITLEGHKALVFSQFTSFLKIVRKHLDEDGVTYEYLDGATRDRQAPVERFQNDPDCKLFLISLKAGGLGLNLTSAGYVFLLDPWWNPAVEAQAVDRAHRIGQTQQVFAYRLIARDTVEEKVLDLQKTKRDLASAIISQDNSVIKNLQKEDLELLLS
jgi:superfamily II DNA or RNA helicase